MRQSFTIPPGFGFLVPQGSGSLLLACTFVDQKFANRVPQNGTLIRAFFGGDAAERLMRCRNDEAAASRAARTGAYSRPAAGASSHGGAALAQQPSAICRRPSGANG